MKGKSGIHVGNRGGATWNSPTDFLTRLKGTSSGDYPRVVVVLSNQLYNVRRSATGACNITDAQKLGNTYLFDYLTGIIQKGTVVIIRIRPSPGNFSDWNDPGPTHNLIYQPNTATPNNGTYCNMNYFSYRSPRDIADEMKAIYNLNIANGWPATRFYFEPANEPNLEWYKNLEEANPDLYPQSVNNEAWQQMNSYFSAVYDTAKSLNSAIQVLTPPMGQNEGAEEYQFASCAKMLLFINGAPTPTEAYGYDYMRDVYTTKNDGWSWHNYWRQAKEFWQSDFCQGESPPDPTSDHLYQYFPQWLRDEISNSGKPAFITEADLLSPCQQPVHTVVNKEGSVYSVATQNSLLDFIAQEGGADYVAVWLLTNSYQDPPLPNSGQNIQTCDTHDPEYSNYEQAWHEAYRDTLYQSNYERDWFRLWWLSSER
jgi:hypothetical protein